MKKWLFFATIGKCQNQLTPPYFDQLSERHQLLCLMARGVGGCYSLENLLLVLKILANVK